MKSMSKVILIIISFGLFFIMSSCNSYHYEGKEISSIEYITIDFMGGYTSETVVDLMNGQVLKREYFPAESVYEAYEIEYTFDINTLDLFLDEVGATGLFDLEDTYPSPDGVIDGGAWTLSIHYKDGSNRVSNGDNNIPTKIFQEADYAFYHLYGADLFGLLPNSYQYPPAIDISFHHTIGSHNVSEEYMGGLHAINYTWNKSSMSGVDVIQYAVENQLQDFNPSNEYKFVLSTANYEFKFSRILIASFDINGEDEKAIENTKWFKQKEYTLEMNRIYIITMTFSNGTCVYAFSTISD